MYLVSLIRRQRRYQLENPRFDFTSGKRRLVARDDANWEIRPYGCRRRGTGWATLVENIGKSKSQPWLVPTRRNEASLAHLAHETSSQVVFARGNVAVFWKN